MGISRMGCEAWGRVEMGQTTLPQRAGPKVSRGGSVLHRRRTPKGKGHVVAIVGFREDGREILPICSKAAGFDIELPQSAKVKQRPSLLHHRF